MVQSFNSNHCWLILTVWTKINFFRQFSNVHFEAFLNVIENFRIIFIRDKGYRKAFSSKASGTSNLHKPTTWNTIQNQNKMTRLLASRLIRAMWYKRELHVHSSKSINIQDYQKLIQPKRYLPYWKSICCPIKIMASKFFHRRIQRTFSH